MKGLSMLKRIAAALLFLALTATPAYADFCSDKVNGLWCNGDNLVYCQNGSIATSDKCDCGCKSMPFGTNDQCESCGGDPFCQGKMSGLWCKGDDLVNCQGGSITSSEKCDCGCKSNQLGVNDQCKSCGDPFCDGKQSGLWCKGDDLVNCQGGSITSSEHCEHGCVSMPQGTNDKCGEPPDPPTGFCSDKANGLWCDGDNLVDCQGAKKASSKHCEFGCLSMPPGTADKCGEPPDPPAGFCDGKMDGFWCNGMTRTLCGGGGIVSEEQCENGCKTMPEGVDDTCIASPIDPPDQPPESKQISVTKVGDCGYFDGHVNLWTGTGLPVWNQLDHPGVTLGTCDGLSIATSGCLVTTLAMLYEYLGVERTVGEQKGNSPEIENLWRSQMNGGHTIGFAGTNYTAGGVDKWGECLVIWAKNPPGVSLHGHYNPLANCIRYQEALAIAGSLNGAMPVAVGVHWVPGAENQHWVLAVGADANGLIINDPYGGLANARLDQNNLGNYVVDSFYTPQITGGGGTDPYGGAFDEDGNPLGDDSGDEVPIIRDPGEGEEGDPGYKVGESEVRTSGCSASGRAEGLQSLLVLLALAGLAGLFLRGHKMSVSRMLLLFLVVAITTPAAGSTSRDLCRRIASPPKTTWV